MAVVISVAQLALEDRVVGVKMKFWQRLATVVTVLAFFMWQSDGLTKRELINFVIIVWGLLAAIQWLVRGKLW